MSWWLVILLVVIAAAAFLMRGRGPAASARFLRRTGLTFICATTLFIGLFVAGETFTDPGGWKAAGLVALWLVPMAGLSVLAWYRPGWATIPLAILTAGTIALAVWFAADPGGWRAFEDHTGPVRALVSFAITLPIGLLGWRKPVAGGVLLLVLGIAPVAVSAAGSGFGAVSLTAISIPPVLTGLLYLFAELIGRRAASPGPAPEQTTAPGIGQPGPPPADGADADGTDGAGQHTPGPGGTGRPAPGPDTPRRAA
jgi:hypothetical protein